MAFPTTPIDGQVAIVNGIRYTYATATNSWTRSPAGNATLSVISDSFVGDGSTISYTLSNTPVSVDVVTCIVDGVPQLRGAFTLSSNILTFTGTPANGALIEVRTMQVAGLGVLTGLVYDSFTGNGSTTAYTLTTTPTNKNFTIVSIGGLVQNKVNYSVSGTTLTFTTAPPNTSPIEVITLGPAITTSTPNTLQNGTSSVNVLQNGNVTISSAGTSNVVTVASTGLSLTSTGTANLGNLVTANYVAGTLTTNAQPNVTSVGTLTSLSVDGLSTLANVTVTGLTTLASTVLGTTLEIVNTKTGAFGNVTHDISTGSAFLHTSPTANFTPSFTNVSVTDNRATTIGLIISQGATAYVPGSNININSTSYSVKWQGNVRPSGTPNGTDVVSYTIARASGTYYILGVATYYV